MASGFKDGPAPGRIWVLKNEYEIRYYTTPETLAQAVVDGYDGEVVCYRLDENPTVETEVRQALRIDPADREPRFPKLSVPMHPYYGYQNMTAADEKLIEKHKRDVAAWRKRRRAAVIEVLTS